MFERLLGTSRHKTNAFMFLAIRSLLVHRLDLHIHVTSLASAHGVEMKLARVAPDATPYAGAANVTHSETEARKMLLYPAGLAARIDAPNRFHFPCADTIK